MRIVTKYFVALSLLASLFSCNMDHCEQTVYSIDKEATYHTLESLRSNVGMKAARDLKIPGKIYSYGDLLLIGESYEGIHFFDVSNPEKPVNLRFLNIPGNTDFAIKDNKLFANNQVDLLTFDITDLNNISLEHIAEQTFRDEYNQLEEGFSYYLYAKPFRKKEVMSCEDYQTAAQNGDIQIFDDIFGTNEVFLMESVAFRTDNTLSAYSGSSQQSGSGTGGSMAAFTIVGNYLYTIDPSKLYTFSIAEGEDPQLLNEEYGMWGMETLFPSLGHLFVGTSGGMIIYDLSNPAHPTYKSSISHVNACDPVYVKDDIAYVTLRSGNFCDGFSNQLELIDVSNLSSPQRMEIFPMHNPHGLSIAGDDLYLCDGGDGLKVFDITDPMKLNRNMIERYPDKFAFDVITLPQQDNLLIMIGIDGLGLMDFSDPNNLKELSVIDVNWN